ncbi:MAG TPA: PAS domain S-box protein [Gammaproteobacteria bacterium]|nr:PAS domain S-box protein [Gammaproteobacteria bacterium]
MPTNAGALSLLHKLASTPASADDALKLLHELQVHQVELDLQNEQLDTTRRELAEDLARYRGLYQFAPTGYFNVGSDGDILEGNLAGADLFGVRQGELVGRRIDSILAPGSRPVLLALLQQVRENGSRAACEVTSGGEAAGSRQWRVVAGIGPGPGAGSWLIVIIDLGPSQAA